MDNWDVTQKVPNKKSISNSIMFHRIEGFVQRLLNKEKKIKYRGLHFILKPKNIQKEKVLPQCNRTKCKEVHREVKKKKRKILSDIAEQHLL